VSLDTNERLNRVKIGLSRMEAQAEVERRLRALKVPPGAVMFEKQSPSRLLGYPPPDPTDRTRPVVGGTQIDLLCTLSFVVRRLGVDGFVTASHCSDKSGVVDGTMYDQPGQATPGSPSNRVGTETVDPAFSTGGDCPSGRKCRISDTLFAAMTAGVTGHQGQIIHPDPDFPANFSIQGTSVPLSGETVFKVGRTTGWSDGEADDTCVDISPVDHNGNDPGNTFLCQNRVKRHAVAGDSGSPVFQSIGTDPYKVLLAGVLTAGNASSYSYSPIGSVQAELGLADVTDVDRPPTVTITDPPDNATVPYGALTSVTFTATATDFEDGANCCTFTWKSDKDGNIGAGATRQYFFSTPGDRTVTVTATDHGGNTATSSIHVSTHNSPPKIWIVKPDNSKPIFVGASYVFEGSSFDSEIFSPLPCTKLTWSSSNPQDASFPQNTCSPQVSFATPGSRQIILTGVDAEGAAGVATATVNVLAATGGEPIVSILNPTINEVVDPSGPVNSVNLTGIVTDASASSPISYRWYLQGSPDVLIAKGSASSNKAFSDTWKPTAQQVPFGCGGYTSNLRLEATGSGMGSDSVKIYVAYPVC